MDAGRDAGRERLDGGSDAAFDGATDGQAETGDAGSDAGGFVPTNLDVPCETTWTELDDPPPAECAGREITDVAAPFMTEAIAVGRASDGTLTLVFNESDEPDRARVATVSFHEDTPGIVTAGPTIDPTAAYGEEVGTDLRIAPRPLIATTSRSGFDRTKATKCAFRRCGAACSACRSRSPPAWGVSVWSTWSSVRTDAP